MNFEEYLISKKIDSQAFRSAEPDLWESWKNEFDQLHPNSFTMQKLNLINPIRRKYLLKAPIIIQKPNEPVLSKEEKPTDTQAPEPTQRPAKPAIPKPVFKPKPKT